MSNRSTGHASLEDAGGGTCGQFCPIDPAAPCVAVPDLLRAQARLHPDRVAIAGVGVELTYAALDRAADRVANALLADRGARLEAVVLLFDTDALAAATALGVLRAGKFFVGVEPTFSRSRLAQIADDADAAIVLTDGKHLASARELAGDRRRVINVENPAAVDERPPGIAIPLESVALVNYTSGSTGKPKGVVHTHRSMLAHAVRYASAYRIGDGDRLATFGSLAWAGTFWDVYGPLCLGGSIAIFDVRVHGLHGLPEWLGRTQVTVLSDMPIVRRIAFDTPDARLPRIRLIQLGGDTVYRRDIEACQRVFPNAVIAVGLGTSEAGRVAEQFIPPGSPAKEDIVPVGFPVPGVRIALVDADGDEVAAGATGEIVIHCDDLAPGYRNLPALTEEKFRVDPRYGSRPVYFTGDLGRIGEDGMLRHAGRKDFQVKIHGYQVPAHEIEAMLLNMEGIRDACVVAQPLPNGSEQLAAFLVCDPNGPSVEALQAKLRETLPGHMIPRRFVRLDALPKTPTDKIDRNALPNARAVRPDLATGYVAPRNAGERVIAAIWRNVLAIDKVGVDDDFLALGGDSLQAAQIVSRVLQDFGLDVPISELLARNSVAEMAALVANRHLLEASPTAPPPITPRRRA